MKDKFKVKWSQQGWGIYHSRIGIFWSFAGTKVYQNLVHAAELCAELNKTGKCPDSWFGDGEKKKPLPQARI